MFSRLLGLLAAVLTTASAYDVGCLYPDTEDVQDLFSARREISWSVLSRMETPMVVHSGHEVTMCQGMCQAYHTPFMKDPLTNQPSLFTVPEFGQNGYSMMMCNAQCLVYVANFERNENHYWNKVKRRLGFDIERPSDRPEIREAVEKCDLTSCAGDCQDLCNIIRGSDFNPYTVGHYLGVVVSDYFKNDGWNSYGTEQYSPYSDEAVPCSGNCRLYQDTTGYSPQPNPRDFEDIAGFDHDDKYVCEGRCRNWQPLQEGDEFGNLVQQEFVAVHIGKRAKTYLRNATITLEDPGYDLYNQTLQVIEEVKETSMDMFRKDMVNLMDDKLKLRRIFQDAMVAQFAETGEMSFESYLLFLTAISNAEIDGLVQAWHEKAHHDLVRPTTVIKSWDDEMLYTFGGDREADGPVEIMARDFEAYIRVMPHAEFPSGSSCLCTAYMETIDAYLNQEFGRTITNFTARYIDYYFEDMAELRYLCGQSRIWGGMHYPEAVPAGEEVCGGLGILAMEWADDIKSVNNLPFEWFKGDELPACGAGTA